MKNNYLYATFDSKIDALNLPAATSEDYKKQNRDAVLNYVLPAFTSLSDGLQNLRDTGTTNGDSVIFLMGKNIMNSQ